MAFPERGPNSKSGYREFWNNGPYRKLRSYTLKFQIVNVRLSKGSDENPSHSFRGGGLVCRLSR